jgi:hypothetical protein
MLRKFMWWRTRGAAVMPGTAARCEMVHTARRLVPATSVEFQEEPAMSRLVRAAALSAALLSLAAVDAAAAPNFYLPCNTVNGHNVTVINNTGMSIPAGSRFIIHYFVAGKLDQRVVFTSPRAVPAHATEPMSYMGAPISHCIVVVKFPPRYATNVNRIAKAR